MNIHIQITQLPILLPVASPYQEQGLCGAEIEFQGKVRSLEKDQDIKGLLYEAYEAMAEKEIRRLLLELSSENKCLSAEVIHRLGWVPVDEVSVYIRVRSKHRKEGFELLNKFLDRLKQDVPIWKSSSRA